MRVRVRVRSALGLGLGLWLGARVLGAELAALSFPPKRIL